MLVGGKDAIQTIPSFVSASPRGQHWAWPTMGIALSVLLHAGLVCVVVSTRPQVSDPAPSHPVDFELVQVTRRPPPPPAPKPEEKKPPSPAPAEKARPKLVKVAAAKPAPVATMPKPVVDPRVQPIAEAPVVVPAPSPLPSGDANPGEGTQDGGAPGGLSGSALGGAPDGTLVGSDDGPVTSPGFAAAYLHNPPPQYPAVARRLQLQGTTMFRVLVSSEGRPKHIAIEKSSGVEMLDQAAMEAVREWSFVPARKGTKAIEAEVLVPVRFHLSGAGEGSSDSE